MEGATEHRLPKYVPPTTSLHSLELDEDELSLDLNVGTRTIVKCDSAFKVRKFTTVS